MVWAWSAVCVAVLLSSLLTTGEADKCQDMQGTCRRAMATCRGVSRTGWCRYPEFSCCFPPRGKRRRRRSIVGREDGAGGTLPRVPLH